MTLAFKIALAADLIAIVVAWYFLYKDYTSSSSSSNGTLGMATIGFIAWVCLSYFLHTSGYPKIGTIMAWIPAIPIIGYGVMVLLFVILKPDMR
ncbi:MAG TPA: hypothetical protein VK168_15765 [Saprospiraceae bacterium]|nr:hypothetical protein [Saprospiraceae bacterium]